MLLFIQIRPYLPTYLPRSQKLKKSWAHHLNSIFGREVSNEFGFLLIWLKVEPSRAEAASTKSFDFKKLLIFQQKKL